MILLTSQLQQGKIIARLPESAVGRGMAESSPVADGGFAAVAAAAFCWWLFTGDFFCRPVRNFAADLAFYPLYCSGFEGFAGERCRSHRMGGWLRSVVALRATVESDFELAFADPGGFELGEQARVHAFRQVDQTEFVEKLDAADVFAGHTGFTGDGADDVTGLNTVVAADFDAVGFHAFFFFVFSSALASGWSLVEIFVFAQIYGRG